MKEKLKRWFARPVVRHAASMVLGLVLSQTLARIGIDQPTAHAVGQAIGRTVEG